MNIVVAGCAGLLGSHLANYLLDEGHHVIGIDNLSTGVYENIDPRVEFIKCDMRNRGAVDSIVKRTKPEIVYMLAAFAHEGLSQFCPNLIVENNFNIAMNMLTSSIRYKVKRFVFTSSMSIYGDQIPPFTEDMPYKPVDIYGITKAAFEQSLKVMSNVYGIEYTIIRPHNVIGIRQALHDPYRNVVGIFMNRLLADKPFYIYGDGEQRRAFSFVNDFTPYLAKCGWIKEAKNETFNIGADKPYSINKLAEILLEISGKNLTPIYVPDRPQEVDEAFCSNEKAKKILSFEDKTSFRDGLKIMWEWAQTIGPQKPRYLQKLELTNELTPKTWTERKI
jgi:UDP-glucose 4-epimerase